MSVNLEEDYELHIFHGASSLLIVYSVLGCSSLWRKFSGAKQGLRRPRVKRRHLVRLLEEARLQGVFDFLEVCIAGLE